MVQGYKGGLKFAAHCLIIQKTVVASAALHPLTYENLSVTLFERPWFLHVEMKGLGRVLDLMDQLGKLVLQIDIE